MGLTRHLVPDACALVWNVRFLNEHDPRFLARTTLAAERLALTVRRLNDCAEIAVDPRHNTPERPAFGGRNGWSNRTDLSSLSTRSWHSHRVRADGVSVD